MSATDYNPWGVAWEIDKAAVRAGRWGYSKAQNAGMRYQNWRHKGAGDGGVQVGGTIEVPPAATTAKKGSGKNWTTDEESLENTTTSHTTYTRKRTR